MTNLLIRPFFKGFLWSLWPLTPLLARSGFVLLGELLSFVPPPTSSFVRE